jgi:hypothetical protein
MTVPWQKTAIELLKVGADGRSCHLRAIYEGQSRYRADNHGHCYAMSRPCHALPA